MILRAFGRLLKAKKRYNSNISMNQWFCHFSKVLGHGDFDYMHEYVTVDRFPLSASQVKVLEKVNMCIQMDEIERAIRSLRNGKAPGLDGIFG